MTLSARRDAPGSGWHAAATSEDNICPPQPTDSVRETSTLHRASGRGGERGGGNPPWAKPNSGRGRVGAWEEDGNREKLGKETWRGGNS